MRAKLIRATTATLGIAAATYVAYVAIAWLRYGHVAPATDEDRDPLLDRFMPTYEVAERHQIRVAALPALALSAAENVDLRRSAIINAIFKTRERILGATADEVARPRALLDQMKSLGWGVLAEVPGREIVVGAVTQPWKANVVFRALPPHEFATFNEPEYVKIVWTLRADPDGDGSIARTETRVYTTDRIARAKFRRYWAFFSPGIVLIRRVALGMAKREAELTARPRAIAGPPSTLRHPRSDTSRA
jgi:hypothetical protein